MVKRVKTGNTIVLLPTGSGKTLIAAEAMRLLTQNSRSSLFLVPTCMLVEQQAKACRSHTGLRVAEFMGGLSLPSIFDILVSTPSAFLQAQQKYPQRLSFSCFDVVCFDEVHHVLKDHPYRHLALLLRHSSQAGGMAGGGPRVLGLTASLTYAVEEKKVKEAISRICSELRIEHMATATKEELEASGYHGTAAVAEVSRAPLQLPQGEVPDGVVAVINRKAHLMVTDFFNRARMGTATKFGMRLLSCIRALESGIPGFSSPLVIKPAREWGKLTLSKASAAGQVEIRQQLKHLSVWYEALRILLIGWEEVEDATVTFLRMLKQSDKDEWGCWPASVRLQVEAFWRPCLTTPYTRFNHLREVLLDKLFMSPEALSSFRCILFVEQRIMTHIIAYVIESDPQLQPLLRTACLYATDAPGVAGLSIGKAQAAESLSKFASGQVNLLITTVVAEEGMDIPEANCVIRFDPLLNSVSFVQGRGRARQSDSSFVVLSERDDRSAKRLSEVEKQQQNIVGNFVPINTQGISIEENTAQLNRERGAQVLLLGAPSAQTLNEYRSKTKALIQESFTKQGNGNWSCDLLYTSCLRSASGIGSGTDKKRAKGVAVAQLMEALMTITARSG